MKKALFLLLLPLFALVCCNGKSEIENKSVEKVNRVSVIIDDQLWKGEIGDSLRNKFASPVVGLPQEEPLFTINQYPVKLLEGYMSNSRNIIIVKKGEESKFQVKENEFFTPQNVIYIYGKTTAEILNVIEQHSMDIIKRIRATEIRQAQQQIVKSLRNDKIIAKKFKVAVDIPEEFKPVMQRRKFLWFKKEITSGSSSIIIYEISQKTFGRRLDVNKIIRSRDSIGHRYIHGTKANTDMMTENSYAPYFTTVSLANRNTSETRGSWQLENDFMSGPFVNYCIYDAKRSRYIIIEGFCYAPSREKRDLMFELEAILKTVRFNIKK